MPYDYGELAFSNNYIGPNLAAFASPRLWIPLAALGLALPVLLRDPRTRRATLAALLAAAPISLFHLRHYYVEVRFHPLLIALGCVAPAAAFARYVAPAALHRFAWAALPLVAAAAFWPERPRDPLPGRRATADALARLTPNDAVIVTAIDPLFLEPLVIRGTKRRVIPASRAVAFAADLVAPRRVAQPRPAPRDAYDRRCAGLIAGGSFDPVPFTAREDPLEVLALVRAGHPVFVDLTMDKLTGAFESLRSCGLKGEPVQGKLWLVRLR